MVGAHARRHGRNLVERTHVGQREDLRRVRRALPDRRAVHAEHATQLALRLDDRSVDLFERCSRERRELVRQPALKLLELGTHVVERVARQHATPRHGNGFPSLVGSAVPDERTASRAPEQLESRSSKILASSGAQTFNRRAASR